MSLMLHRTAPVVVFGTQAAGKDAKIIKGFNKQIEDRKKELRAYKAFQLYLGEMQVCFENGQTDR